MIRPFILVGFLILSGLSARAQVALDISIEQSEYLLFEAVPIRVKVTNLLSEPLNFDSSVKGPWLDFYMTVNQDEEVGRTQVRWTPPNLFLKPGEMKTVEINITPLFKIRDPGEYRVAAQIRAKGAEIESRTLKFSAVKGVVIWQQRYTAPADNASSEPRPRLYTLMIHRTNHGPVLYARIENPEEHRVYCTVQLGAALNYGEPQTRIDRRGNLHVLHQSGTRIFNYCTFSPSGKRRSIRFFTNIASPPKMVAAEKDETQIIGGEEIFVDENQKETVIPTPRIAEAPKD